ncbi:hypothetical protein CERSUDRAFT_124111 [Gelatoporia subvermispora B]|uniref:Uncharacterized protein n=1 Tax=Ceriporiopsis subvermispora (strain B) TaxID=914234 RepID=M2RE92_CERS8|nr:hypothetical protein CERSUDRAFT_124111 [Gelatoporia subvermispora B]
MRFLRLSGLFQKSGLFHKRSRSDTALAVLPSIPTVPSETRPASTGAIYNLASSSRDTSDVFAPYISAIPLSITVPNGTSVQFPHYVPAPPPDAHPQSQLALVLALTKRIHDLEAKVQSQSDTEAQISALKAKHHSERDAHHALGDTNARLAQEVRELQGENTKLRGELYVALSHSPATTSDERMRKLAAENAALVAERVRHRRFIELMISVGAHKPVLDRAYQELLSGEDPEAALVASIKEALARPAPDNVWRELLEPVVGRRSPEEYLAQVRCTLSARRETRDWRKRAKFWKATAVNSKHPLELVTPSPSDISSILEELSPERQKAVDDLARTRRNGCYIPRGSSTEQDIIASVATSSSADVAPSQSVISALPSISEVHEEDVSNIQVDTAAPPQLAFPALPSGSSFSRDMKMMIAAPSLTFLPTTQSSATVRSYVNLPPLASQAFRDSHSIKGIASRSSGTRRSADLVSPSRSITSNGRGPGLGASTSSSSQSSSSSRCTPPKLKVDTEEPASDSPTPSRSASSVIDIVLAARATASTSRTSSIGAALAEVVAMFSRSSAVPAASRTTTTPVPSSASSSSAASSASESVARSSGSASGSATPPNGEDGLVLIMPGPAHTPQQRSRASANSSAQSSPSRTPASTPDKKSRLPVLARAVRRLSISRPMLVDTTNAATFGFSTVQKSKRKEAMRSEEGEEVLETPKGRTGVSGKEAKGRSRAQTTPEATSPVRPSKIPMGRRIKRFSRSSLRKHAQTSSKECRVQ